MSSRVLLTAAAAFGLFGAGAASAADLPAPMAPSTASPIYSPAPAFNWGGLHIGVQGGYGWGTSDESTFGNNTSPTGGFGGANIGYDWAIHNNWILGVEADANIGDLNDSVVPAFGPSSIEQKLDYFGTVRGRIGYALGDNLLYGTGGWAWGHGVRSASGGGLTSDSQSLSGWTAGAGIEHAFSSNVVGRLQYLRRKKGLSGFTATLFYS